MSILCFLLPAIGPNLDLLQLVRIVERRFVAHHESVGARRDVVFGGEMVAQRAAEPGKLGF